jgi:AraC family transcriptional regulator
VIVETAPFSELPRTFGSPKDTPGRRLSDAPWRVAHDYGVLFYCPASFGQAHIRLQHHLLGIELDPGIVRTQINSGPLIDSIQKSHSVYFIPAGTTIEVRKEQPIEFMLATLDPRLTNGLLPNTVCAVGNIVDAAVSAKALELRRSFLVGGGASQLASQLVQIAAGVLRRFCQGALGPSNSQLNLSRVRRALNFIGANYSGKIAVEDIAGAVGGMSAFHFAHAFESTLGQSPYQYVLEHRLRRAREMLVVISNDIADIAYSVGFSSQAHMTETFSRRLGITPAQMRRSMTVSSQGDSLAGC